MPAEKIGVNFVPALVLAASASTGLASIRYGAPPPVFDVPTQHGAVTLSQLHGKPVVINFWASWCPPCTQELPYFARLQKAYGNRITLVTISNEPAGVARSYLVSHHYALPLLEDSDGKVFTAYSITPIPDTLVLDEAGNVRYVSVGGLDWNELKGAVDRAFDQPAALPAGQSK
ncbi:MAG: TlpA family protein disulfide reductase [Vulcanimicrobiaceae bacterium]